MIKMVSFYSLLLFATIFLFYLIQSGVSIECYSCDSFDNDACNDPFNETLFVPTKCENENFACVKHDKTKKEINRTYLHRGCIQKHYCETFARASDFCYTCTNDLCNSSFTVAPSFIFIAVALLLIY